MIINNFRGQSLTTMTTNVPITKNQMMMMMQQQQHHPNHHHHHNVRLLLNILLRRFVPLVFLLLATVMPFIQLLLVLPISTTTTTILDGYYPTYHVPLNTWSIANSMMFGHPTYNSMKTTTTTTTTTIHATAMVVVTAAAVTSSSNHHHPTRIYRPTTPTSSSTKLHNQRRHHPITKRTSSLSSSSSSNSRHNAISNQQPDSTSTTSSNKIKQYMMNIVHVSMISILLYLLYDERHRYIHFFQKEYIQQQTLSILQIIQPSTGDTTTSHPYQFTLVQSCCIYIIGMSLWEMLGLSTIPVETAAGMIYPYSIAVVCSICGKVIGASITFLLGRILLPSSKIQSIKFFQTNKIFQLLLGSQQNSSNNNNTPPMYHSPWITTFCMKFSCFPEMIKNIGSSCISSIQLYHFIMITILHGGLYTLIWTWLGYDTALRLHATSRIIPPNHALQITLVGAMIMGVVITPLIMTWWIHDLQSKSKNQQSLSKNHHKKSSTTTGTTTTSFSSSWNPMKRLILVSLFQNEQNKNVPLNNHKVSSSSSNQTTKRYSTTTKLGSRNDNQMKNKLPPNLKSSKIQTSLPQKQQPNNQFVLFRLLNHCSLAEIWILCLLIIIIIGGSVS